MDKNRKSHTHRDFVFFWTPTQRQQFLTRMFLAKKISYRKVFPLKKKAALYADYEAKYQTIFLRPKFTALIFWEHLNNVFFFGGGGDQRKDDWKHCSCLECLFHAVPENKIQRGQLTLALEALFPKPPEKQTRRFLNIFCVGYHILSQLCNKAF